MMKIERKIELINELLNKLPDITYKSTNFDRFYKKVKMVLRKCFKTDSEVYKSFEKISFWPMVAPTSDHQKFKTWRRGMEKLKNFLQVTIEELELDKEIEKETVSLKSGKIIDLQKMLKSCIYEQIIKNPTLYQTKSRSISKSRRKAVKERDNFICQFCQETFDEEDLEIDHIYPYSLGGSNEIHNLMCLCSDCNEDKGKRLEYYESDEGRYKLLENINDFTSSLELIQNFGEWLKKVGDLRHHNN